MDFFLFNTYQTRSSLSLLFWYSSDIVQFLKYYFDCFLLCNLSLRNIQDDPSCNFTNKLYLLHLTWRKAKILGLCNHWLRKSIRHSTLISAYCFVKMFFCDLNNNHFRLPFKILFCVLMFLISCLPALISFFMVYCCFLMAFQAKLWWFALLVFVVVFWGGLYRRFSR